MRGTLLFACSALFGICLVAWPALADSGLGTMTAPQVKAVELPFLDTGPGSSLTHQQVVALVRSKIKYVFVIYQENRSFDSYFGTYPGAAGLYSQPPALTPGYYQPIINTDGSAATLSPFLIGPAQYAADTDDLDHTHGRLAAKIDVLGNGVAQMDKFAETEELKYTPSGKPSLQAKQFGELAMAHEDCDTVPFLWNYADRFVLFDHVFQDLTGPSAAGDLAIFAAQSGQTQLALHPAESFANPAFDAGQGEPVLDENDPFAGSKADPLKNMQVNPGDAGIYHMQLNQTYASLAVSLAGGQSRAIAGQDENPAADLADIRGDIAFLSNVGNPEISWGWFQEGYDKENADTTHGAYITHHDGPQYFGYIANNPAERANLHGLGDFFTAVSRRALPTAGGVFFLKGGYQNLFGLKPANPLPAVQSNFVGDDDHPAYSDAQISEATVAKEVNAIAQSAYWNQSAIIITWADSEGDYDHMPPPVLRDDQNHLVESFGPRVPLILISPYAKVHQISRQVSSQSSVVKFIDEVFNLTPLAALPDEANGFKLGEREFGETHLGPMDDDLGISDLLSAFDVNRLTGTANLLPANYAEIPGSTVIHLPHYDGQGCKVLGIIPEDFLQGMQNNVPADFNTLPRTNPGSPWRSPRRQH